jgi:hypothetical protein
MQRNSVKYFVFFVLVFISFFTGLSAQRNISPMAQKAINLFDTHQFGQALVQFRALNDKFPKDILYQYYLGACIIETNGPLIEAVELLKPVILKLKQAGPSYYLGLAYYRQFKFDDAFAVFSDIKKKARRSEIKDYEIDVMLQRIENSKNFFTQTLELSILDKTNISNDSIFQLLEKDKAIIQKKIALLDDSVEIFISASENYIAGQYYYFSMKGKSDDLDIYRARFDLDSAWSSPEPLIGVNSQNNDAFPFFDYANQILYFASERGNSAGGYDIYQVAFNSTRNTFGEVVQLPFPINSPLNDYLWINTETCSYFVSNRESTYGKSVMYKIDAVKKPYKLKSISSDKIEANCYLKKQLLKHIEAMNSEVITKTDTTNILTNIEKKDVPDLVHAALNAQLKADSVMLVVQKIKDKLVNTDDKDIRNSLFSALRKQEKVAAQLQKNADEVYEKIILADTSLNFASDKSTSKADSINDFLVSKASPYSEDSPFNNITTLPDGIIYRIQLAAFSKPVGYDFFGGLQPITAEPIQDGKITKYYVGVFNRFTEADSALIQVKVIGFKEAFVVGYLNNQKIPVERAKDLEISY